VNAIILAAGEGTRLRPLSSDIPKCLVTLFGRSLIEWQIATIKSCHINDISAVVGYRHEKLHFAEVECILNARYKDTNMVESLFCARDKLSDATIVSYGDIIYQASTLKKLIAEPADIAVVIDKNWRPYWELRFANPLDDAETLKLDDDGYIRSIGQKTTNIEEIGAQFIGLLKFQNDGIRAIKEYYDNARRQSAGGTNPLNDRLPFVKSYMTDLLQGLIREGFRVKGVPVNNGWLELDTLSDYQLYNRMYGDGTLKKFFSMEE
jgi:choline kinase